MAAYNSFEVLKRDNGSPFNSQPVDEVMARFGVLPLNKPRGYTSNQEVCSRSCAYGSWHSEKRSNQKEFLGDFTADDEFFPLEAAASTFFSSESKSLRKA